MKKIIPFSNIVNFDTAVSEITAISLENKVDISNDMISGTFFISGEYKMMDGLLEYEKFNFELPFDIAFGNNYERDTLVVDIDDFRYELIDNDKLKLNIDLYIDGNVIENSVDTDNDIATNIEKDNVLFQNNFIEELNNLDMNREDDENKEDKSLLDEMVNDKLVEENIVEEEKIMEDENDIVNNNKNINNNLIFDSYNLDNGYVTYRIYRVMEGDTIDKIIEKYGVTKDDISNYNDISNINVGDKLIIPTNEK